MNAKEIKALLRENQLVMTEKEIKALLGENEAHLFETRFAIKTWLERGELDKDADADQIAHVIQVAERGYWAEKNRLEALRVQLKIKRLARGPAQLKTKLFTHAAEYHQVCQHLLRARNQSYITPDRYTQLLNQYRAWRDRALRQQRDGRPIEPCPPLPESVLRMLRGSDLPPQPTPD